MLVDSPVGFDDLAERHDRLDDRLTLKAAGSKQLPGSIGLPTIVPPRVVPVRLALGSGEDERRPVEMGLLAKVKAAPEFAVPGGDRDGAAKRHATNRVVKRLSGTARLD